MKLSLSTNWCNRQIDDGQAIAEKALELGFDELELGFSTTPEQVPGFKRMLDKIPVGSIHAFCPVPVSAPQGYPELYALASFDADQRALARFHVTKNIEFAAEMGADTVVLHAGRVSFATLFHRSFSTGSLCSARASAVDAASSPRQQKEISSSAFLAADKPYQKLLARALKTRTARGQKLLPVFIAELEKLVPLLEKNHVTLALENLPYLEGFPNETELQTLVGKFKEAPIRGWFDTGHHRVREMHGWLPNDFSLSTLLPSSLLLFPFFAGLHLNDVVDFNDDHLAPGDGKVDFAALTDFAHAVRHVVFEPKAHVDEAHLRAGLALIRRLWS